MAKKVYELAKELDITSKDLIEKAAKQGIELKSHMSTLTDADISKIKNEGKQEGAPQRFAASNIPGAPKKRPPIGRPIVDSAYLDNKNKSSDDVQEKPEEVKAINQESLKEEPKAASKAAPEKEIVKEEDRPEHKQVKEEPKEAPDKESVVKKESAVKVEEKVQESQKKEEIQEKQSAEKTASQKKTEPETKPETAKKEEHFKKAENKPSLKESADNKKPREHTEKPERKFKDRNEGRGTSERRDRDNRESRDQRDGRQQRQSQGGRPQGGRPQSQGGRPQDGNRSRKPAGDAPRISTKNESSKRDDRKKQSEKYDKKQHSKFDKLERKSLEKQTKGKHAKYKNTDSEPEQQQIVVPEGTIVLTVPITVAGFCEQTEVSTSRVIMTLMKLGIMANINQNIDEDTVMILAEDLGISVMIGKVEEETNEEGLELFEDKEKDLKPRPPIITVMGHVDHGKTSLLDAIRKTNVTAQESGGITQHIGASEVKIKGQRIVFLDTPGHEAFTAMRARGAHVTDIAVLVVAADDGVMPQTIESISHAKAAGVPIIVAINKMDKPSANPDRVKQELTEHGVLVEEWGGDVISVPVSAKTGDGIINLLEMILLQAEVLELKANPNRLAMGSVIEARLDKAKGPVATLLVTNGTLSSGQSIVAGTCSGRIRLMTDYSGKTINKSGPATAVEILGLTEVPQAGDEFNAVKEDKIAREIAENRKNKLREEVLARNSSTTLEKLFSQIQEGELKELNLIIKGDVQGSIGALVASLEKLNNNEVKVNIIHTGVGTVTESDVMLAGTSSAVIIGFNVRPSTAVQSMADRENIEIRTYRVIYDVIDDVENAMKGMLDPEFKEELLGKVEIRNTFKVPNIGIIGGAYVTEGKVVRNAQIRLVRDGIVIHEGKISSLKRFKDDAKEVNQSYECGIGIENYNDIKEGDVIECFHMVEIERK